MQKKKLLFVAVVAMVACLFFAGCSGKSKDSGSGALKVGMVCLGDENHTYDSNFLAAKDAATEALKAEGINVEWDIKYNIPDEDVEAACGELANDGCKLIICNSYGHDAGMVKAAKDYPEIQFVNCTNEISAESELTNAHNAFARIHEGRYVAGVVAGMKLQEMIDQGKITADKAVIGYVGAFPYAEVISGYSAYYLGAKSVCPSVTMKVSFVNNWGSEKEDANAAQALIDQGCVMISQHSDTDTPATTAEKAGVFCTAYNADVTDKAPKSALISTRVDWTNYFVYAIKAVAKGETFDKDYAHGLAEGEVVMTPLNKDIAAAGTQEKIDEVIAGIKDGSVKVFDTSKFTVGGKTITTCFWQDADGDFVPESGEAIENGEFKESCVPGRQSAPYFALDIDGITKLN